MSPLTLTLTLTVIEVERAARGFRGGGGIKGTPRGGERSTNEEARLMRELDVERCNARKRELVVRELERKKSELSGQVVEQQVRIVELAQQVMQGQGEGSTWP